MSANDLSASGDPTAERKPAGSALRRPTAWLAAAGVVVLLAAAFALSYDGFTALARAGGVSDRLARYYPGVYDAVVVVAFAAIFVLRTARVYIRLLTWLSAILVLAVCAAAGAVHAAAIPVPQKPLAAVVATLPFLMLVLAFRLWLTMLRHIRRQATARRRPPAPEPAPEHRAATPLALPAPEATPDPHPARQADLVPFTDPEPGKAPTRPGAAPPLPTAPDPQPDPEATPEAGQETGSEAAHEAGSEVGHEAGIGARFGHGHRPEPVPTAAPAPESAPTPDPEAAPTVVPESGVAPTAGPEGEAELAAGPESAAELEPDDAASDAAGMPGAWAGAADVPYEPGDLDDGEEFEPEPVAGEDRPPLPVRQRTQPRTDDDAVAPGAGAGGPALLGDEEEFVADDGPQSDPVTDEAAPDTLDAVAPDARADDVDEFAEFEADEADEADETDETDETDDVREVPPPPSGRVRSSPLPPLDWGPGLGGLTGRRRTPRPRNESENPAP